MPTVAYTWSMPKRSSKKPRDVNQLAKAIADEATAEEPQEEAQEAKQPEQAEDGKNPAAVALGRLGGKKGGPARAKKLTKEQRSEIAKKAAARRWGHST